LGVLDLHKRFELENNLYVELKFNIEVLLIFVDIQNKMGVTASIQDLWEKYFQHLKQSALG